MISLEYYHEYFQGKTRSFGIIQPENVTDEEIMRLHTKVSAAPIQLLVRSLVKDHWLISQISLGSQRSAHRLHSIQSKYRSGTARQRDEAACRPISSLQLEV